MPARTPYRIHQELDGLTGKRVIYCELCTLTVFRFGGTARDGNVLIGEHALAHANGVLRSF